MQNGLLEAVYKYCQSLFGVDLKSKKSENVDYTCVSGGG
jgi:hypothetical protein